MRVKTIPVFWKNGNLMKIFICMVSFLNTITVCNGLAVLPERNDSIIDSILEIDTTTYINIDTLKKYSFQLDKEYIFYPMNNGKIITNFSDTIVGLETGKPIIMNPFTKAVVDTIKFSYYRFLLVE